MLVKKKRSVQGLSHRPRFSNTTAFYTTKVNLIFRIFFFKSRFAFVIFLFTVWSQIFQVKLLSHHLKGQFRQITHECRLIHSCSKAFLKSVYLLKYPDARMNGWTIHHSCLLHVFITCVPCQYCLLVFLKLSQFITYLKLIQSFLLNFLSMLCLLSTFFCSLGLLFVTS